MKSMSQFVAANAYRINVDYYLILFCRLNWIASYTYTGCFLNEQQYYIAEFWCFGYYLKQRFQNFFQEEPPFGKNFVGDPFLTPRVARNFIHNKTTTVSLLLASSVCLNSASVILLIN